MDDNLATHMYGSTEQPQAYNPDQVAMQAILSRVSLPSVIEALVNDGAFVALFLTALADKIHGDNVTAGWWTDLKTGEDLHGKRNVGELLALIHSEVSEALEGHRKGLMDDKLTHRPNFRVELIDALIRIFDLLGSADNGDHPAGVIFQEKRSFNRHREDHKPENHRVEQGKKF